MKSATRLLALALLLAAVPTSLSAQTVSDETFAGLELRHIGPALMSGRIADIALHPTDFSTWYVAVASGGVWKTENAGTTWKPVFDDQAVYSTGALAIDPNNPEVIWVGTGENNGGRHLSFGDGLYRSADGGASWTNMGLKGSERISQIVIDPSDSNRLWVAAQGPLWSKGGERGVYMTTDGGANWFRTLGDDEWVGATEIEMDPRNPDRLYAATWQRHRTVAAYMGGGPGSGLHRSDDGGATWTKLTNGLPTSNLGKIGLAISPQQPDVVYAAIELDRRSGAVYRSTNRGVSWEKMSDTVSGATGPHYYQELYASPHAFDRIYLMDTRTQMSDDGGRTFRRQTDQWKHVDDHALAFRPDDPDWLLIGTDGGLYESHDLAKNWRFVANLPVTQFYKLAVDDAEPFYTIYGGTQDNSTQGGPSRTDNNIGIRNADWFITLFADGHQPATEPGNPDIMYSEWQQGNLVRVDRTTGEIVHIKPQPGQGEPNERFNWDAPILVSPHSPTRLYYASHRLWRSENRGDAWTAISGDLTRNEDRLLLPIMGSTQSWDNPWDVLAMSEYNTITSVSESPVQEGLLYIGTDDGLIQVSENGGGAWRRIEVASLPGVPKRAFVNDIKADLHDANTVYVALDNHKEGDYRPFLFKSTDRGRSWKAIVTGLPDKTLVWRLVQDHVNPALLFLGTEFGLYTSLDGGAKWVELTGGVPTISFRDLAIQKRENDLVGASFGRGFFVLDDYSVLREVTSSSLSSEGALFSTRKAWWYMPRNTLGDPGKASQGASYYVADNPPFGAVFTYHLRDGLKTLAETRQEAEKEADAPAVFPGWDAVDAEARQEAPGIWLVVQDEAGRVVRRVSGPVAKGFHRVAWDLRSAPTDPVDPNNPPPDDTGGFLSAPGSYTVTLTKKVDGVTTELAGPVGFEVVRLREGALAGAGPDGAVAFWSELESLNVELQASRLQLGEAFKQVDALEVKLRRLPAPNGDLAKRLFDLKQGLVDLQEQASGSPSKGEIGLAGAPTFSSRIGSVYTGVGNATYGPTATHREQLGIARAEFQVWNEAFKVIRDSLLPALVEAVEVAGR